MNLCVVPNNESLRSYLFDPIVDGVVSFDTEEGADRSVADCTVADRSVRPPGGKEGSGCWANMWEKDGEGRCKA